MKENFIIREERHPVGKMVSKVSYVMNVVILILIFVLLFSSDDYYLVNSVGTIGAVWLWICLIVSVVVGLCSRESYTCGFHIDGCNVKLEGRPSAIVKKFTFTVNGREYSWNSRKIDDLDMQIPDGIMQGACWYACASLEGGHKIAMMTQEYEAVDIYMVLDGVIVVENGFVYRDKIEQIMSGGTATPTPAPVAPAPRAIDTGVMPPFQTVSNNVTEKTVAPKTKRYTIVGQEGVFASKNYDITSMLVLGRDAAECSVVFPADTAGVSRVHCKLVVEADGLCVYDLGSTYGTVVNNNKTLSANQMMKLNNGDTITVGSNQTFVVKIF